VTPISGWGRYPRTDAAVIRAQDADQVRAAIAGGPLVARGLGRSYGDSANAPRVLSTRWLDRMIDFDPARGLLRCEAGVSLAQILDVFVPRGWFLPVTPGTRFVTVGGAIAADVHGKNHHRAGTFGTHVESIALMNGDGERIDCAADRNGELFLATCGGMGLTGVIVEATVRLTPIRAGGIEQTTLRARSLDETLSLFDEHAGTTYSVAWVDTFGSGRRLGRSLLMLGEHATAGALDPPAGSPLPVPPFFPGALLTATSVRAFNAFYYHRPLGLGRVGLEAFFYPLDRLAHWNRLYGRQGFLQYHFVVPRATGAAALHELLARIAAAGRGSFLAVLKLCGAANDSPLSFPLAGYSLALDLKADAGAFALLDELDPIVLHHGGRIYLTKDARMSEATFKTGYPRWAEFEQVRARCGAHGRFTSNQSRRLGLQ
jgi:decaprenylphospho-beta-D-ribofuranose 2-oxidase